MTPVCLNCKSESGCKCGDRCLFRRTEADGQPSKESKKSGGNGSVASLKENIQTGCVSQCVLRKSLFCGKLESWDQTTQSSSPRPRCVTQKNRERKGPSQGVMQKCAPQERIPWAPKIRGKNARRNPEPGAMRPQRRMGRAQGCL